MYLKFKNFLLEKDSIIDILDYKGTIDPEDPDEQEEYKMSRR